MIEPALMGQRLAREIRDARPEPGTAEAWRLGQAGLLVRFPTGAVLVDAYLSNHCEAVLGDPFDHRRMTRAPLDPVDLDAVDVVICTHDHLDHLDPPTLRTLARQNPRAVVVAPAPCRDQLRELGWDAARVLEARDGSRFTVGGLEIETFAVPHEDFDAGPDGDPYLGVAVTDGEVRIAHLGDALAHPRIVAALRRAPLDLLALPINGRDAVRHDLGFAGNMTATEAVDLARESGAALSVPIHYDMFAQNVDPDAVAVFHERAAEVGLPIAVREVGARFVVRGSDRVG
jgi:L-ascorbate 6-phosphate lactonase